MELSRAKDKIDACFFVQDEITNNLARAADGLLDFTRRFAPTESFRKGAMLIKARVGDLQARARQNKITEDARAVEARNASDALLDLLSQCMSAAEKALVERESLPDSEKQRLRVPIVKALEAAQKTNVVLSAKGLTKNYRSRGFSLRGVDLELKRGEITGVVGVNGSGKSTLLRLAAGALFPEAGEITRPALNCSSKDWVTIRRRVGYVEQRPEPWNGTVEQALILQAAFHGETGPRGRTAVDFFISRLGLDHYRFHTWRELAGGFRTRFELARVLLGKPAMLVLDEPLAALDIPAQMQFLQDLRDFATDIREPMPVLISSQHIYEIEAIADVILVLDNGQVVLSTATNLLGADRTSNYFEISCAIDAKELSEFLKSLGRHVVSNDGPRSFLVRAPLNVTGQMILQRLLQQNVTIRHFRDISCSTRPLLE